jgi:hypothetical protein
VTIGSSLPFDHHASIAQLTRQTAEQRLRSFERERRVHGVGHIAIIEASCLALRG